MNNNDQADLIRQQRARQMARAIIDRSREAGIPEKYLRLKEELFREVLCDRFHKISKNEELPEENFPRSVEDFSNSVYNNPSFLLKRDFIVIDGGDFNARQRAGFAILFRMISYDKRGMYVDCTSLSHKLQSINSTYGITRNDLTDELKRYDLLFIGDFNKKIFSPHFETGSFFDEILAERVTRSKTTIVSFTAPIDDVKKSREEMARDGSLDAGCGFHFANLSFTNKSTNSILRVRVKSI